MLLQIGPLLRLGPNVITDWTLITLGSNYYTRAFYRGGGGGGGRKWILKNKVKINFIYLTCCFYIKDPLLLTPLTILFFQPRPQGFVYFLGKSAGDDVAIFQSGG